MPQALHSTHNFGTFIPMLATCVHHQSFDKSHIIRYFSILNYHMRTGYFFDEIASVPSLDIAGHGSKGNLTLAIGAMGGTGNVLFEIASGSAIAARYELDACLDSSSRWYPLASELAPMLNHVPEPCPDDIQGGPTGF